MKLFRIYRNLNKGNFSIQSYLKDKKGYRVTDRANTIIMENCTFKIYNSGRQRVIKEKRKNVHAYIEAVSYNHLKGDLDVNNFREIYYNPYTCSSFIYKDTGEYLKKVSKILAYKNKLYDISGSVI